MSQFHDTRSLHLEASIVNIVGGIVPQRRIALLIREIFRCDPAAQKCIFSNFSRVLEVRSGFVLRVKSVHQISGLELELICVGGLSSAVLDSSIELVLQPVEEEPKPENVGVWCVVSP